MDKYENEIMHEGYYETGEISDDAQEPGGSGKGFKIAAGIGLAALAGLLAHKYVIKPIAKKIKAKKQGSVEDSSAVYECEVSDSVDESEE